MNKTLEKLKKIREIEPDFKWNDSILVEEVRNRIEGNEKLKEKLFKLTEYEILDSFQASFLFNKYYDEIKKLANMNSNDSQNTKSLLVEVNE